MTRVERICIAGLWHLGSVLSACWASLGHMVVGADDSVVVTDRLRSGQAPVFEPGLDDLLRDNLREGRLTFTTNLAEAAANCDVLFVAFDTPVGPDDELDLTLLNHAITTAGPRLTSGAVVVVSSQVPVGTCAAWRAELHRLRGSRDIEVVYSPENLRLGEALKLYLRPDRIVIGADDDAARERITGLFAPMQAPVLAMSLASAEMTKHALNGYLATSISFINEIADLCEVTGADVRSVVAGLKSDGRIGPRALLAPGLGFAGGTLGRDVQVLRTLGQRRGLETRLLDAAFSVNARRSEVVMRRLMNVYGDLNGLVVGAWGLTYKPGTSTLRRSIAVQVVRSLVRAGASVRAFDPKADLSELSEAQVFLAAPDAYAAAAGASALIVLTEWPEFATVDFDRVRSAMTRPVIIDARNLLVDLRLEERGFHYVRIGS